MTEFTEFLRSENSVNFVNFVLKIFWLSAPLFIFARRFGVFRAGCGWTRGKCSFRVAHVSSESSHRKKIVVLALAVVLLGAYVYSFSSWWMRGPSYLVTVNGKPARCVELHMTPFRWRTFVLWTPAILYMKYVCGYKDGDTIAAGEDSVYSFIKIGN